MAHHWPWPQVSQGQAFILSELAHVYLILGWRIQNLKIVNTVSQHCSCDGSLDFLNRNSTQVVVGVEMSQFGFGEAESMMSYTMVSEADSDYVPSSQSTISLEPFQDIINQLVVVVMVQHEKD